jgi:hypothetical protein
LANNIDNFTELDDQDDSYDQDVKRAKLDHIEEDDQDDEEDPFVDNLITQVDYLHNKANILFFIYL